jgi:DNA-binding CsgD family transcriptional regulator
MKDDSRGGQLARPHERGELSRGATQAFADRFHLTAREREVFASLVVGRAQKETAAELGIAASTVRFHAVGSYAKCGVQNQREMLAFFARWLQQSYAASPERSALSPTFSQLESARCDR